MRAVRTNTSVVLASAAAAVVLATGSTMAVAAATGGFGSGTAMVGYGAYGGPYAPTDTTSTCAVPSLSGSVVDVALTDMGGAMGGYGGRMGDRTGRGMMGGWTDDNGFAGMGAMMSVQVSPTSVPSGTVSLRVANDGALTHELVVLPLADGAQPGQRAIGSDGAVSEDGSLGEASNTCAAGEGDGIAAGSDGWVTLDLAPGHYELVCNLPGHYAHGMYAELDVTG